MESIKAKMIIRRMEEYERDMQEAEKRLDGATDNLKRGFIGSTIHEATEYQKAKAKYEAVEDIVRYFRLEDDAENDGTDDTNASGKHRK